MVSNLWWDREPDNLYERLELTYAFVPRVGKEGFFDTTMGKLSLHNKASPNAMKLIDRVEAQIIVIYSTRFS